MNRETVFYLKMQDRRLTGSDRTNVHQVHLYVHTACELAEALELGDFPLSDCNVKFENLDINKELPRLLETEKYLSSIWARNIFELDAGLKPHFVLLDESWRSQATSYVSHVREVVNRAELSEQLRQGIMNKINALQNEIDRNQTRVTSACDVLVEITAAMSVGAKHLEPAVKLVERILGSLTNLSRKEQEEPAPPQLPPPESLGLPDPEDLGRTNESDE